MRVAAAVLAVLAAAAFLGAGLARAAGADEPERLPAVLDAPDAYGMAGFTLVDWSNGLAFDLDPRTRAVVQPHCNLAGGFLLQWPEADTDCDPAAVFEPVYTLEISAYHSFSTASPDAQGGWEMLPADEVGSQRRLDALQAVQMRAAGRLAAGEALVRLPEGERHVPYYTWQSAAEDGLSFCLEYMVFQPDAAAGPQIVTVTLRCGSALEAELIEVATQRLRLFKVREE